MYYFSNHSSIIFIVYEKATIKISLNLSENISQLKKHIEEIIGVKEKDQALYFNHKLLSNNFKLYSYDIKEKSKITLLIRQGEIPIGINVPLDHNTYLNFGPFYFSKNDSIENVKEFISNYYFIPKHRQAYLQHSKKIKQLSDLCNGYYDLVLVMIPPEKDDLIEVNVLDKRKYTSEGGISDFKIKIDLFENFISIFWSIIRAKNIKKKNTIIAYNNKTKFEEFSENDYLEIAKKNYLKEDIIFVLKDFNNIQEVLITDCSYNNNLGQFKIKLDLLGNIIKQIKQNKNIEDKSLYLSDRIDFQEQYPFTYLREYALNEQLIHFYLHDGENFIDIFIKSLTGKTHTIRCKNNETIENVKFLVIENMDFFPAYKVREIRLIFAGKNLEDNRTLLDYNIKKESTLHVVLRLCGGQNIAFVFN